MEVILAPLFLAALAAGLMWCVFRRSVAWSLGELFLPLLSPTTWILIGWLFDQPAKTLSNFFLEIFGLAFLPVAYVLIRRFAFSTRVTALGYIVTCSSFLAVTLAVFFL